MGGERIWYILFTTSTLIVRVDWNSGVSKNRREGRRTTDPESRIRQLITSEVNHGT